MSFWKDAFSGSNVASWGRVAAAFLLVLGSAWVTRLILLIKGPEQYDKLGAVGIFLGVLITSVSALYGISKGLDVYKDIKGNSNGTNP